MARKSAKHSCSDGSKKYVCAKNLQRHQDVVHKKITYQCSICSIHVARRSSLIAHINIAHKGIERAGRKKATCPMCRKTFSCKASLTRHSTVAHQDSHVCGDCNKKYTSLLLLDLHARASHSEIARSISSSSSRSGSSINAPSIQNWARVEDKEQPTQGSERAHGCLFCSRSFMTLDYLQRHTGTVHSQKEREERAPCVSCTLIYDEAALAKKAFSLGVVCQTCHLGLDNLDSLHQHIISTHGAKMINCVICRAMFTHKEFVTHTCSAERTCV